MKKLLNIMASLLIISAPSVSLMSCNPVPTPAPIPEKKFSNEDIVKALVEYVKTNNITIKVQKESIDITVADAANQLRQALPQELTIGQEKVQNYDFKKAYIQIEPEKTNNLHARQQVNVMITYNAVESNAINLTVGDVNDDNIVKFLDDYSKNNKIEVEQFGATEHKTQVTNTINKLIKDHFQNSQESYEVDELNPKLSFSDIMINGNKEQGTNDINDGIIKFQIKNNKLAEDSTLVQEFNFTFYSKIENDYQTLDKKLTQKDLSFSLRDLSLASFITPEGFTNHFKQENQANISNFLENFTVGDLVNDLLDPNGTFASLMPNVMPALNSKGIDDDRTPSSKNYKLWNYVDTLSDSLLKNYQINWKNWDFASSNPWELQSFKKDGFTVTPTLSLDLYNLLKNILPDLIHFHNYLLNNVNINKNDTNYLLLFIKYLFDKKQDYNYTDNNVIKTDGFSNVNASVDFINTNFDNLVHDLLDGFSIGQYVTSTPGLVIKGTSAIKNFTIQYSNIANADSTPTTSMLIPILENILAPKDGLEINSPIAITFDINLYVMYIINVNISFNQSMSLANLHKLELKTLITKQFNMPYFDDDNYTINSGYVFLQAKKQDINSDEWVDIHSIDDLQNITDLRFQFRNMQFQITDKNDKNVYLDENNITMNLNL